MKANYNVTGNDRKALVAAIEKLTGDKAVYMRMPTCAYEIGDVTVDKEGGVTCEDADKLERIIHSLIQVTVNRVMWRFAVFALASLALLALCVHAFIGFVLH